MNTNGTVTVVGSTGAWQPDAKMSAVGDYLYVVESGQLWRLHPTDGSYAPISDSAWGGTTSISAAGDRLIVVQANRMHTVNPNVLRPWSSYTWIGSPNWDGSTAATQLGANAYIIQNTALHRVDSDGTITLIGSTGVWLPDAKMTALGNSLFVIENRILRKVNPVDGTYRAMTGSIWDQDQVSSIFATDNFLCVIYKGRLVRRSATSL